ncbi:MAG: hypothetical protein E5Y10_27020 [Mesorhizobium sp.]|nr:MAG: hypothetical protein E5Y10_27020 [Mesorhizobium sp.]
MKRSAVSLTQLTRAVKAVTAGGVEIGRVDIDGGRITIWAARSTLVPADDEQPSNEWDEVLHEETPS